ncbi:MAG: phosphoribosylglycinamide formyltransferase [Bacteroidaceae bacterium]|nr:phosphoribosylglycinamide formyltransferase [Bacteroidaceae bacterium]
MITNVAILASGNGSNAENIARYFVANSTVKVSLIITNSQKAYALQRARNLGIPCAYFSKEFWQDGHAVLGLLRCYNIGFIVLAGFLAKVPDIILQAYPKRMVNIHPSLLPLHGGKGMYGDRVHEDVLRCGEKESGITIHYTSEVYDAGQIIVQYKCVVKADDTPDSLATRVHALEYEHYPKVIEQLLKEL